MRPLWKILAVLGWLFAGVFVIGFLLLMVFGLALFRGGSGGDDFAVGDIKTDRAIAVVDLSGEILTSDAFRRSFEKAMQQDEIKAAVVRIESPGGTVGASEEIYRTIKEARKPTVCSLGNIAASGGLYAAAGCNKVVVNNGTLTGSIGVILMMPNLSSIMNRFGVEMNVIKSGRFKDAGSPFRSLDSEDRNLMQTLVNKTYEQFVRVIAESRKLSIDQVKKFADGRIILGEEAVQLGLADAVGGLPQAAKLALQLAVPGSEEEPEIVLPKKQKGLLSLMSDVGESSPIQWLRSTGRVRLLYQAYL